MCTVPRMSVPDLSKQPRLYVPGLDALRGLAVIIGWLYHTHLGPFGAGYMFVDMFGVLSGYLISSLLLKELEATGRIRIKLFYIRRARRLLPALVLTVCGVVLYSFVTDPNLLGDLRGEVVAILLYMYNWYILAAGKGYFYEYSTMPLRHMWTLSIEEQFYIILPAVFLLLFVKLKVKSSKVPYFMILLAIGSAILSAWLYFNAGVGATGDMFRGNISVLGADLDRMMTVYMSTFTRAGGFLVGVALSFWWRPELLVDTSPKFNKIVDVIGLSSISLIILLTNVQLFTENVFAVGLGGGSAGLWLLCVGAIVGFTRVESRLTQRIAANKCFVWLGVRAYGLYLFTWPVAQFYRKVPFKTLDFWYFLVSGAATLVVADLSYRYFENPIRKYGLKMWLTNSFSAKYAKLAGGGMCAVLLGVAVILVTAEPTVNSIEQGVAAGSTGVAVVESTYRAVVVGDSTVLAVSDALAARGIATDAERGRGSTEIFTIAKSILDDKQADMFVIHAGNFGDFTQNELREHMASLADARLIVLVTVARYDWSELYEINSIILSVAKEYPNTVVFDWYGATQSTKGLLEYDGVHMTEAGKELYATAVANILEKYQYR